MILKKNPEWREFWKMAFAKNNLVFAHSLQLNIMYLLKTHPVVHSLKVIRIINTDNGKEAVLFFELMAPLSFRCHLVLKLSA